MNKTEIDKLEIVHKYKSAIKALDDLNILTETSITTPWILKEMIRLNDVITDSLETLLNATGVKLSEEE